MSKEEEFGHMKEENFGSLIFRTIMVYLKLDGKKEDLTMTRPTFEYIVQLVRPFVAKRDTQFRKAIPVEKRMAIALWRVATGNSYRTIREIFVVAKSLAVEITNEIWKCF